MFLLSKVDGHECHTCGGSNCCTCPYHHHFVTLVLNVFVKPNCGSSSFPVQCEWWTTKAVAYALSALARNMPNFSPNALNWATLEFISARVTCTTRARLAGVPPSLGGLATHLISELYCVLSASQSHISDACNLGGYLKLTLERRRTQFSRCSQTYPQPMTFDCVKDEDGANQIIRDEVLSGKMILSSNDFSENGLVAQHNTAGTFYFLNDAERLYWLN